MINKKSKEEINREHKEWRIKNPKLVKSYTTNYYNKNKDKIRKYQYQWCKNKRKEERLFVIKEYGGKCECCGENNFEFLALDHIKGGGRNHIKELLKKGFTLTKWAKNNNCPNLLRLLCHNCNMAKGIYGYCPHRNLKEDCIDDVQSIGL